ncbi:aminopeptidase [Alloscardovia theropitheci]|uniref:Aminopeptidase n=1 Tax=Alloscardovia theropitheci TaxID=2496842 RepID=A0A4R0QNN3_9BIFI|nr:C1 family peptidase [Alloscardovia theropitheci]TCD53784.1 aminopeptidase [Alloscardovia theropitheci]
MADKALALSSLSTYSEHFNAERANRVAANAAVSMGVLKAATSYAGSRETPMDFNIELKQGSITNQERSGRCWMFAGLNVLRYELMHKWNLADFEFSENYLFFWEKMEKANSYLEYVIETIDAPVDDRRFQAINEGPVDDGNWWKGFADLVSKYGLVPKSAYPESANSRSSDDFIQYINSKMREFAAQMRQAHKDGETEEQIRARKDEYMDLVYRMCAISLGEPPVKFDFFARVEDEKKDDKKDDSKSDESDSTSTKAEDKPKDGKDTRKQIVDLGITPMEFYKKYVPVDVNDYETVINSPLESTPYGKRYAYKNSATVIEAGNMDAVNVDLDTFRNLTVQMIKNGHPVWFACDCTQFSLRGDGFFDENTVRVDELFGTTFNLDKAQGLEYMDYPSNHAMTFVGVNLDEDGNPNRWRVENSWGKENGKDGYYAMTNKWFDRFVREVIIRKEYLDPQLLEAETVELEPWQPVSRKAK